MAARTEDADVWVRHGDLAYRVVAEAPVLRVERAGRPDHAGFKAHCLGIVEEAVRRRARLLLVDERGMEGFLDGGLDSLLLYREITRANTARARPMRRGGRGWAMARLGIGIGGVASARVTRPRRVAGAGASRTVASARPLRRGPVEFDPNWS